MRPYTIARFTILHVSAFCIELTFEADQLPETFDFSFDNFRAAHVCKTIWCEDNVAGRHLRKAVPCKPAGKAQSENSPLVKSPPSALAQVIPWCIFGPRSPSNLAGADMASDGWIQLSWWGKSQKAVTRHNLVIGGFWVEP
jgi:hypothetical protein